MYRWKGLSHMETYISQCYAENLFIVQQFTKALPADFLSIFLPKLQSLILEQPALFRLFPAPSFGCWKKLAKKALKCVMISVFYLAWKVPLPTFLKVPRLCLSLTLIAIISFLGLVMLCRGKCSSRIIILECFLLRPRGRPTRKTNQLFSRVHSKVDP